MKRLDAAALDLAGFIQPGNRVVVGQVSAEPQTLAAALPVAFTEIGPFETFLGTVVSGSFEAVPSEMPFAGYGAMGKASRIARRGRLDVWPMHYNALEAGFAAGVIRADIVLIQLAQGPDGFCATLANDYVLAAARHARCVIAEVNARAPWCAGTEIGSDIRIDAIVETDREPVCAPAVVPGETEQAIARHVAALVPDGATIQIGIGAIPDAVLDGLAHHRDLGIHSGVFGDRMAGLLAHGVFTNARKSIDPGQAVANVVVGSRPSFDAIDRNDAIRLAPAAHTHAHSIVARQERMIAINAAIEVDLSGQANAELADGAPVGGAGGLCDFTRGATAAKGGRAIIALRATDRTGRVSRIVPQVQAVTLARTDIDTIVTEYGVAELRHRSATERARALIAIAAPQHREMLERSLFERSA
ncbi:acetyl-CoA hydrolase/transferase family protein [Bosea sp. BH3]|uniref:acetyl-CoA hydrolase/transferase family protein n=1 Tax=Bosea sp. BH3 TaxID=2871701 RepID=UPI0021CB33B9|nr:acetyl-CoA hydrolase/transferase C-terminal domain-containing protein [Bosea sp. BH3]MCU4178868.1 4-hydroxybutyrate CoA-transferase [Bosea sp. BH3]